MPTGWPFFAHTMAQLAWPTPLPASFFATEHATSTTSPFTVISEAKTGMASATTNAVAATIEITLRMRDLLSGKRATPGLYFTLVSSEGPAHDQTAIARRFGSRVCPAVFGHPGAGPAPTRDRRCDQPEARRRAGDLAQRATRGVHDS